MMVTYHDSAIERINKLKKRFGERIMEYAEQEAVGEGRDVIGVEDVEKTVRRIGEEGLGGLLGGGK